MDIKLSEGRVAPCFLEVVRERRGEAVIWSNLREPTEEEVEMLKRRPCDHKNQSLQLVYDEPGPIYDFRFCAICKKGLGTV